MRTSVPSEHPFATCLTILQNGPIFNPFNKPLVQGPIAGGDYPCGRLQLLELTWVRPELIVLADALRYGMAEDAVPNYGQKQLKRSPTR
jgi:hypothetical protein